MTKQDALNFLGQIGNDFLLTLPKSARECTGPVIQQALNTLAEKSKPETKQNERHAQQSS